MHHLQEKTAYFLFSVASFWQSECYWHLSIVYGYWGTLLKDSMNLPDKMNVLCACREVVRSPMVEAQCLVQLCFPVELKNGTMVCALFFSCCWIYAIIWRPVFTEILRISCIIHIWACLGAWGMIVQVEEIHFVGFLSKLLETKIMQVLRFKHGQVYTFYQHFPSVVLYGILILRHYLCAPDILCWCFSIPWW